MAVTSLKSIQIHIIIILIGRSCIAQIFPLRKLNTQSHTIYADMHTDLNIIYTCPHTHTHIKVRLDLWKCLLKKESFELGFKVREGGEIPQAGRQRIPDSWGNKPKERSPTDLRLRVGIFNGFPFDGRRMREV